MAVKLSILRVAHRTCPRRTRSYQPKRWPANPPRLPSSQVSTAGVVTFYSLFSLLFYLPILALFLPLSFPSLLLPSNVWFAICTEYQTPIITPPYLRPGKQGVVMNMKWVLFGLKYEEELIDTYLQ